MVALLIMCVVFSLCEDQKRIDVVASWGGFEALISSY